MRTRSKIIISVLSIIFAISTISNSNFNNYQWKHANNIENQDIANLNSPRISGAYSDPSIYIDGNWSAATTYNWCYGNGTWEEPYTIENLNIDAGSSSIGSGIFVKNSKNDYFTIRNCTVYNAGSGEYDAGIKLKNTNNGTITNNNCSNNGKNGILLLGDCQNNTISENIASNTGTTNQIHGIHLEGLFAGWFPADTIDISPNGDSSPLTWPVYGSGSTHYGRLVPRTHNNNGLDGQSNHIDTYFMEDIDINEPEERIGQLLVYIYVQTLYGSSQIGINGSHESLQTPQYRSFPTWMAWRYYTFSGLNLTEAEVNNLEIGIIAIGGGYRTFIESMYVDCYIEKQGFIGPQGNIITGNIASKNNQSGIALTLNCTNNIISGNFLSKNGYGIYLDNSSDDNSLFCNSLSENSIENAYDDSSNDWNNTSMGNYWGDNKGVDTNNDGIGDSPYSVAGTGGSNDYNPLMNIKPYFFEAPDDVDFEVGTSGNYLIWKAIDISRFLLTYDIFMNGLLIESGLVYSQIADIEFFIDGLTPDNYIFTIEIYDAGGTSSSDSVWVTVGNTNPVFSTTPDDLVVEIGEVSNNLSWIFSDMSTNNPTYTITRNNVPISVDNPCVSGQAVEISVDGLDVGSYGFTIKINDGYGGTILDSVWVTITDNNPVVSVPSPPQSFSTTTGDNFVALSWTAPTDDGGTTITSYRVYRGTTSGEYLFVGISTTTSFNDTVVLGDITYYYVVTAINIVGESDFSVEVSATPTGVTIPESGTFPSFFFVLVFLGALVIFTRKTRKS